MDTLLDTIPQTPREVQQFLTNARWHILESHGVKRSRSFTTSGMMGKSESRQCPTVILTPADKIAARILFELRGVCMREAREASYSREVL